MVEGKLRTVALALFLVAPSATDAGAQTASQGDPRVAVLREEFHSPMVVNTVLAAADKSLWHGTWFSVQEYKDLGKFTCDGVSLRSGYKPKYETWNAGLQTAAEQVDAEHVRVRFRVTIHNPDDNHDKIVGLMFEVLKGDEVVKSASMSQIDIEEDSADAHRETSVLLATRDLEAEPRPTLRITMTAVND